MSPSSWYCLTRNWNSSASSSFAFHPAACAGDAAPRTANAAAIDATANRFKALKICIAVPCRPPSGWLAECSFDRGEQFTAVFGKLAIFHLDRTFHRLGLIRRERQGQAAMRELGIELTLIHIRRNRRYAECRSRRSPY